MKAIPLSLYVHIPFCAYRCRYCNFTFETGWSDALMVRTLDALVAEAEALRLQGERDEITWRVRTLYLGGGTPSVVPPRMLNDFLRRLESVLGYRTASLVESTVEVNPENCTQEYLGALADSGISRISLGVQTMDSDRLALLGRWCDGPTNRRALDLVATYWKGKWNADLMTGLPGGTQTGPQRWIDLRNDLKEIFFYGPGHVSLYSLTVEPQTDLKTLLDTQGLRVPEEAVADQLWLRARQTLLEAGYDWYEISNFARPGHRSVHNQAYWRLDPWAGLGPGAEGTLPYRDNNGHLRPMRTKNPRLFPWLTGQRERLPLGAWEFALEHFLVGWRTSEGIVPGRFDALFGPGQNRPSMILSDNDRLMLNSCLADLKIPEEIDWHGDFDEFGV